MRLDLAGRNDHDLVEYRAFVGGKRMPLFDRFVEISALRHVGAPPHILKSCVVRSDHSGASPALYGHIANRHPALHRKLTDALSGVLNDMPGGSGNANLANNGEDHIFGRHAVGERAVDSDFHGFGFELAKGLSCKYMLDLGRSDAHSESAESAVCAGVAVAANYRLAWLRMALFWSDNMHDALQRTETVIQRDAELFAVALKVVKLTYGDGI